MLKQTAGEVQSFQSSKSAILERKIEETAAGLQMSFTKALRNLSEANASTIIDYIAAVRVEVNPSDNYRKDLIDILSKFARFTENKYFRDITRVDIISFFESYRRTDAADPLHKWIGTYNTYRMSLLRFFKWLYFPEIEPGKRPKPSLLENIPKLRRKETSIYKPSDLWTQQDDLLFLRYCPTKREKCYHAISRDLSCRPHEILKLKIKDIAFKALGTYQYVEVVVNGKTGTRPIPLIKSIPYLKDYLDHEHPQPRNTNAPLICGMGNRLGRHISSLGIARTYAKYKREIFPKLLESPNVLPEDKQKISELLKKPWNPYIRRHSALTEKSTILKEHVLRQHAGWSIGSQMPQKYLHYFGNESNESLLEAYGIIASGQQIDHLKPKQCPNCLEPNKPDSKFCAKCRMVLTYDTYNDTMEENINKDKEILNLKERMNAMQESQKEILDLLKDPAKLLEALKQN